MSVLKKICDERREAVLEARQRVSIDRLQEATAYSRPTLSLKAALSTPQLSIIAEHKRASPSEGSYGVQQGHTAIAESYVAAGAAALSVLTEPNFFGGDLQHLRDIRAACSVPLLRKDFIVDAYQLHEAKAAGADAVLLIAAALTMEDANALRITAHHLELEVLLEIHGAHELDYVAIEPDVIGVNNRDLKTLRIDLATSDRLAQLLPSDAVRISESGIKTVADAQRMADQGYHGLLIGTQFMKQDDPGAALSEFLQAQRATEVRTS